jgi:1-acyl-sn-glycerol-3-phosphate acyltransferase
MTERKRVLAPTVGEIERRFHSPAVLVTRPVILGGIRLLSAILRFSWSAQGLSRLKDVEGPVIFASNHCSHADTAAILGTLPWRFRRRTVVAAALDVFGPARYVHRRTFKAFKRECLQIIVAAGFHAFAFDRHGAPMRSVRTAVQLLRNDWNLLLYPEGTRSRTGEMASFKPGVGVIARKTGRPVIPVHVLGGRDILPCGRFLPQSGHARVRYGRPMHPGPGESHSEFTARVEEAVRHLASLRELVHADHRLLRPGFASVTTTSSTSSTSNKRSA